MAESTIDDGIGPQLSLAEVSLPPSMSEGLADLLVTDEPPSTAAEWATAMRETVAQREGRQPTAADLCTSADGRHSFEPVDGDESSFVCVLDPLVVPFLTGEPGTVRSSPPVGGAVRIEVTADGVTAAPEAAVVSLGVDAGAGGDDHWAVYEAVCPYVHAFDSRASYESWAGRTDAVTTAVSVAEGVALARELSAALFEV